MHPLAQCRGQLLKEGLPKRLYDWPAWTESVQKSSGFKADQFLVTTPVDLPSQQRPEPSRARDPPLRTGGCALTAYSVTGVSRFSSGPGCTITTGQGE